MTEIKLNKTYKCNLKPRYSKIFLGSVKSYSFYFFYIVLTIRKFNKKSEAIK